MWPHFVGTSNPAYNFNGWIGIEGLLSQSFENLELKGHQQIKDTRPTLIISIMERLHLPPTFSYIDPQREGTLTIGQRD